MQNNSNAVTESQANKGMRELALGYQAWKDGAKWRGADMSKMSAKSAAEFIKIHVKASNKRAPTVGSKELSVEDRVAKQDEEFFDSITRRHNRSGDMPIFGSDRMSNHNFIQ